MVFRPLKTTSCQYRPLRTLSSVRVFGGGRGHQVWYQWCDSISRTTGGLTMAVPCYDVRLSYSTAPSKGAREHSLGRLGEIRKSREYRGT